MPRSTLTLSTVPSLKPDSLPIEAEVRAEDLESTVNVPDQAIEEAEETEEARRDNMRQSPAEARTPPASCT
jgi:hypothetical protein